MRITSKQKEIIDTMKKGWLICEHDASGEVNLTPKGYTKLSERPLIKRSTLISMLTKELIFKRCSHSGHTFYILTEMGGPV